MEVMEFIKTLVDVAYLSHQSIELSYSRQFHSLEE